MGGWFNWIAVSSKDGLMLIKVCQISEWLGDLLADGPALQLIPWWEVAAINITLKLSLNLYFYTRNGFYCVIIVCIVYVMTSNTQKRLGIRKKGATIRTSSVSGAVRLIQAHHSGEGLVWRCVHRQQDGMLLWVTIKSVSQHPAHTRVNVAGRWFSTLYPPTGGMSGCPGRRL